jgi:pimeloyl-ACP methyl ester carboxylesterase
MVFVHGFGGNALKTWGDFPALAMTHPDFAGIDLIFLGYPSRSSRAAYSADLIYRTLDLLLARPQAFMSATFGPARAAGFAYDKVILVGHSLGGALVRAAAQTAKREGRPWAEHLRLALFAPAHLGADILMLAKKALGFSRWAKPALAALMVKEQSLIDLEAGSPFLSQLLDDAKAIGCHPATRARLVVHAESDPVVSPNRFYEDPPNTPYARQDHVSCCKPTGAAFDAPVLDVAQVAAMS